MKYKFKQHKKKWEQKKTIAQQAHIRKKQKAEKTTPLANPGQPDGSGNHDMGSNPGGMPFLGL